MKERPVRRPRGLFGLMLRAFVLMIVLGVGGMGGFFALAVAGPGHFSAQTGLDSYRQGMEFGAENALNRYYLQRGTWQGVVGDSTVTERLATLGEVGRTYTLLDPAGTVITTTRADLAVGTVFPAKFTQQSNAFALGINGRGGILLITLDTPPYATPPGVPNGTGRGDLLRGLLSAGLALAAVLIGLAAAFARRISRPLGQLTQAAGRLAAGDLAVRVPDSAVREINGLAGAFNHMAAALGSADAQRRQLTADVAHELRTPLAIIRARLEGIQDGVYQAGPDQVTLLLDETALLERLIEDLRLLALADAGQLPLYPEPLDPADLLRDAADLFAQQAAAGEVTLRVDLPELLPEISADPQRLAQVLGNLVSNALRYTPPGGMVVLRAWADPAPRPTTIHIAVTDSGQGIAPADLPHIFDRFWRADRARVRTGGTGLGLAIARRIVEAHGGQIQATSAPGQGTTMTFAIPLTAAPEAAVTRLLTTPAAATPLPFPRRAAGGRWNRRA